MGYAFLSVGIMGFLYAFIMGMLLLRKKSTDSKKKFFLAFLFLAIFLIGAYEIGSSEHGEKMEDTQEHVVTNEVNSNQTVSTSDETIQEQLDSSIGVSVEQFVKTFNEKAPMMQTQLRITHLDTNEGPGSDSFQYYFTDTLILTGTINKNTGELREVGIIGGNDGTTETAEDILAAASLLITSTQTNASVEFGDDVIGKLGFYDKGVDLSKIDNSTVLNGIKYYVLALPSIGLSFGARSAK
ncbi:hypothetical protein GCM10010912_30240 [Paenibacillus albidus]|uniref:Uncharacterized protein n=2 Tax=Paenibacillus albidus TaxID=2041023 RepID=A0A917CCH3_9BACL|nr:hypothetical protein GCM10010912_30240 [Paenibacillus albidus]